MDEYRIHGFLVEVEEDLHPATIDRLWAALLCFRDVVCVRKLDDVEVAEVRGIHQLASKRRLMKARNAAIKWDAEG